MYSLILLGIIAFVASLVLTPAVRNLFRWWGVVDHPSDRKVHTCPVPRVGGVSIALAYLAAFGVLVIVGFHGGDIVWSARLSIWHLLPAAILIFTIGLCDDLVGLKPWQKIAGQVIAAGLAYSGGVHIQGFGGYDLGHWWSFPATVLWLLLCTNAVNLIDGVDGLAAGVGLFATMTTLIAALLQRNIDLALATAPLAGALLGFLRFNFNPATIFLGDSGSLFIGFLLGCYGVMWSQKSATILGMTAPLMALAIPLLDTSLAIVRRFLRRQPIFTADRGHIHHRLLDRGLTHRRVALMLYACCALGAIASLAMMNQNYSGFVIVAFCAVTWIGIQHLGYIEFGLAGRLLIDGVFRRHLNAQIALQTIEQKLTAAASLDDCWSVIQAAANEFGFHQIRMQFAGRLFEHGEDITPLQWWTIRVPISDYDFIELDRTFGVLGNAAALAPFACMLKKTLSAKLPLFEPWKRTPQYQSAGHS